MNIKRVLSNRNRASLLGAGLFLLIMALIPAATQEPYLLHVLILCMMYSALVTSWNLISGYMGVFTFGFQALFGFGAYASSLLCIRLGMSPWISIFIGGVMAMCVGAVVAIPSLKLRLMPYICISTMCLGEIVRLVVSNLTDLTRGELGLWGMPEFPNIGPIVFEGGNRVSHYYLIFLMMAVVLFVAMKIVKSPMGLSMNAIRDSQDAAESLGINVSFTKVKVFMVASLMAGIVGGFYAHYTLILTPTAVLGPKFMTELIAMGLIGGLGTIAGPILGAFLLTLLMEFLRLLGDYRLLVYGALIIVTVIFLRSGIWGTFRPIVTKKWSKWLFNNKGAASKQDDQKIKV